MTNNTILKITALLSILFLVSCTAITPDYEGSDAGYVVIGIGATKGTEYTSYRFDFRKADGSSKDSFFYFQNNPSWDRGDDYENDEETGVIDARALPPGDYELYSYHVRHLSGAEDTTFSPIEDFSIPFSIRPGETAYLGNYQANGLMRTNFFGVLIRDGAYFIYKNTADRDIGIAKQLKPGFQIDKVNNFLSGKDVFERPNVEEL